MSIYHLIKSLAVVVGSIFLAGCSDTDIAETDSAAPETAALNFVVYADSESADLAKERQVQTLRLIVFDEAGAQLFNKSYPDAGAQLQSGNFQITERLPRNAGNIRVCVIANERSRWNLSNRATTYAQLQTLDINYEDDYTGLMSGNGEFLDVVPGNGNFVMLAETEVFFGESGARLPRPLKLVRMVAKVTLSLRYAAIEGVNTAAGDQFEITSVMLENQPLVSYLTADEYDSADEMYLLSQPKSCVTTFENGYYQTEPLTFYLPEHYLSDAAYASKTCTRLLIEATYTTGGIPVLVSYRIPIGDGMQKHFANSSYVPAKSDYTVSRNRHYVVDALVKKLGEIDGVQVKMSIADWVYTPIEVDRPSPYLNLSEVLKTRAISDPGDMSDMLFFWTNQPRESVDLDDVWSYVTRYNPTFDQDQMVGELETLYPDASYDVQMHFYEPNPDNYNRHECSGYVDVTLRLPTLPTNGDKITIMFYVRASNYLYRLVRYEYYYVEVN